MQNLKYKNTLHVYNADCHYGIKDIREGNPMVNPGVEAPQEWE